MIAASLAAEGRPNRRQHTKADQPLATNHQTLLPMTHRIILFRGMNTGGVRAPVSELRAMAADMGLKSPRTRLASGNLVVESDKAPTALEADIEVAMEKTFGLKVAAMVRSPEQWAALVAANPFPGEAAAHPAKVVAMVMKDGIKDGALEAALYEKVKRIAIVQIIAARFDGREHHRGKPHLGFVTDLSAGETRRGYADDREALVVNQHRFADH